ncbi:MAG: glycosyltransferase family A protein [Hyphomicrobiales bacterium]
MEKISVIIPALNAENTIGETLSSVLRNQYISQVILVDNASTDDTSKIASAFEDARIEVLLNKQRGIAHSLNVGFKAATSKYIARCDADDLFPPDRTGWQYDWLENNPEYTAVSAGFSTIDSNGAHIANLACNLVAQDVTEALLHGKPITHFGTWLVRRSAIQKVGGARPWFTTAEDVDLQMRLSETGNIWYEPRIAYNYRLHDSSITHSLSSSRVEYFDQMARLFALQRRANGKDDLQSGREPDKYVVDCGVKGSKKSNSALDQSIGFLQADAWRNFKRGDYVAAKRCLLNAVRKKPHSYRLWVNYCTLVVKILYLRIFS